MLLAKKVKSVSLGMMVFFLFVLFITTSNPLAKLMSEFQDIYISISFFPSCAAEIKVDVKKAKGKKKTNNKKKPEESNLFKVIDFTDGGSTLEAKTDSQSDEQTDSQTEVKMDTDDSQDSQKQSQETHDHKLDVPVNA